MFIMAFMTMAFCFDITFDYQYKKASGLFYYVDYQLYVSNGYSGHFNTKPYSIGSNTSKWCHKDGMFCVQDYNVGATEGDIVLTYANKSKKYNKKQFHEKDGLNQIFDRW